VSVFRRVDERWKPKPPVTRPEQAEAESPASVPGIRTEVHGHRALVTVDLDTFGPETRPRLLEDLAQGSGLPIFEGPVHHGYSMRPVGPDLRCPRCHAATRQQMAHFIYATDVAPRVMFAPAGHFCPACPTVVVDEGLIERGLKEGYRFRAVVGLDYAGKKEPDFFRTWNGREPIYMVDECGQIMDLVTEDRLQAGAPAAPAATRRDPAARTRRKMARQSRKRNRR
jgi:hypothetical protein